jgi:cation-transporting ATPase 13A1
MSVDETKLVPCNPEEPFDKIMFRDYDICVTGAALKQFQERDSVKDLVSHTWVYARVSPSQKEFILHTLKDLGFTTLMAGDGTNDVGALKAAHIGVALLDGTTDDLKAIAEHHKLERMKKVYEQQCSISARFNQPPPPPPPVLRDAYPELVKHQQEVAAQQQHARKKNPMEKVNSLEVKVAIADDSSTWPASLPSFLNWTRTLKFPRSSLETLLAPLHSLLNCPTSLLVSLHPLVIVQNS